MHDKKIKVLYLISNLGAGGAETMLYKLLTREDKRNFVSTVVSLTTVDSIGKKIEKLGIKVYSLGINNKLFFWLALMRLIRIIEEFRPNILVAYMCHAYFVASIVSIFFKKLRIIWNIRQLDMDARINRWTTRAIIKICSYLSKYSPCRIVYCAQSGARFYESIGYDSSKTIVLSNGFDLSIFKPDASKYVAFRKQLGLKEGVLVVGIVARFNVAKDYHTFIQAATLVARQMENVVFVCCGHNVDWKNVVLSQWIKEMTLEKKVYLFGLCNEVQDIMVAFDILVSSSISEAFSNVIGEAMSCGVPCVATDVGDSSIIIGNKDYIVPPQRPELLAQAIIKILHMNNEERKLLQVAVRERIAQRYSLVRVVEQYENLYYQMINS